MLYAVQAAALGERGYASPGRVELGAPVREDLSWLTVTVEAVPEQPYRSLSRRRPAPPYAEGETAVVV
ncbi:MAG: hypothetical protein QW587_03860 [Candidatus Bathyarchaeia archaeon]